MKQKVFDILDSIKIPYENFEHLPVFTCDEAKWVDIPGQRVKSLLLKNKKKENYYMIVLADEKRLNQDEVRNFFNDSKLSFVDEDKMVELIWIKPWSVSPYALVNNSEKNIKVIFDTELKDIEIWFHPLQNDNTVVTNMKNVEEFLSYLWFEYHYIKL